MIPPRLILVGWVLAWSMGSGGQTPNPDIAVAEARFPGAACAREPRTCSASTRITLRPVISAG
jgi:hypothetical protein